MFGRTGLHSYRHVILHVIPTSQRPRETHPTLQRTTREQTGIQFVKLRFKSWNVER